MGKSKSWKAEEVEAACKAYVAATHDSIDGSEQRMEDFARKLHEKLEDFTPPGVAGTGTFTDRDPGGRNGIVWKYIRDNVFGAIQKFNGKMNFVLNSGLSGVTHEGWMNCPLPDTFSYTLSNISGDTRYRRLN